MPRLSSEKINEIRQSVDIVDVIGNYLSLEKKGRNYVAICPFHDDTDPSLTISPEKQIYMCFVCHHGGNVFRFLQDYLKISFMEAVKIVADMGHVDLGDYTFSQEHHHVDQETESLYQMYDEANRIYRHFLGTKPAIMAKDYLHEMGRQRDREKSLDALTQQELDKLSTVDQYPSDSYIFSSHGYDLLINNELVAEAFASLPEQEQSILILHCVLDMADGEIGSLMGMSRSAVQRHRTSTLKQLRVKLMALMPGGR